MQGAHGLAEAGLVADAPAAPSSPAVYSSLSQRRQPRAQVAAVVLVVAGGAAAALGTAGVSGGLHALLPVLPVLSALSTFSAATVAVVLGVLARLTDDHRLRWMASAYGLAALVALARGLGLQEFATEIPLLRSTADAGVAMVALGNVAVPTFALAALWWPSGKALRRALVGVFAVALAVLLEPALLGMPPLVDAGLGFTPVYQWVLAASAAWCLLCTVAWMTRTGLRPTSSQLWISVSLVLLTWSAFTFVFVDRLFVPLWWASHVLRISYVAVPALGLFAGLLRLVATLDRHERALVERLNRELTTVLRTQSDSALDREERERRFERVQEVIDVGALSIVLQPIYDLRDGHLIGVEALSRFHGPPAQPPNVWFDEAASVGLGVDLELAAVAAALPRLSQLPAEVYLAVNVSPVTLASPRLASLLESVDAARLVLEVTEHAPIDNYEQVVDALEQLKVSGARLAIDDAGAGFSSLRHIVRLGPAIIKLDMSLTRDIHLDPIRRSLAASLVAFANENGTALVAEGIESEGELEQLRTLGVTAGQGYLLCRPGPFDTAPPPARLPRQ